MTTELGERRKRHALTLALAALGFVIAAGVTIAIDARSSNPNSASGPIVPGLADRIGSAQRISIRSGDASYQIERVERGDQQVWVMRDRGDYPVLAARLAQFTKGLEDLRMVRRMTSDPSKHARLGVDDPRQGGRGVLVQVESGDRALLVDLILGVETSGAYARRPNDPQTWAVAGDMPPLRDVAAWLDLTPVRLPDNAIVRAEIVPAEGRSYILQREGSEAGDFAIVAPARMAALSASMVTATAEHVIALQPIDVQTAPAIQGTPKARIRLTLASGVLLDGELIDSDGRTWLKLVARAQTQQQPEQEAAALALNERAASWAYALSGPDAQAIAPPLSSLLPQAAPRAPRPPSAAPAGPPGE